MSIDCKAVAKESEAKRSEEKSTEKAERNCQRPFVQKHFVWSLSLNLSSGCYPHILGREFRRQQGCAFGYSTRIMTPSCMSKYTASTGERDVPAKLGKSFHRACGCDSNSTRQHMIVRSFESNAMQSVRFLEFIGVCGNKPASGQTGAKPIVRYDSYALWHGPYASPERLVLCCELNRSVNAPGPSCAVLWLRRWLCRWL